MIVHPYIVLYHTLVLWKIFTTKNFYVSDYTETHHTNKQSFRYIVTLSRPTPCLSALCKASFYLGNTGFFLLWLVVNYVVYRSPFLTA